MGISMILSLLITRTTLQVLTENTSSPKEIFGIFALLTSITVACQFLNDSTSQAMVRFLSISLHSNDEEQTKRYLSSGWLMSTAIGSSIALGMAILAPWLVDSFNVPASLVTSARYVIWLSAVAQIIAAMSQPWYAALGAQDRYALMNFLSVLQQFLTWLGLGLLHVLPFNLLVSLTLVWNIPSLAMGLFLAVYLPVQKPYFRLSFRYIRMEDCKQLLSLGGWSSLISFATNLYERTDQVLINVLLGPALNAVYAVAVQLGNAVGRLVTALTSVLLPTASRISSNGTKWEKQQLILRATRYVLTLALPCAVGITIFRREIIELWLGQGFEQAIAILPLVMFLVFSRIPIFVTWPYLTAANQLKLPALAMLSDGLVNVALSVWYVKAFNLGLAGIVLGTLSTNLIRFIFFQIPFVAKLVEMPVLHYWQKGYGKPAVSMLWLVPTLLMIQRSSRSGIMAIALLSSTGAIYALWVWWFVFDEYERKLFLGMLQQLLRKGKAKKASQVI